MLYFCRSSVFASEEEPCEFCARRKLECVEVLGPKTGAAQVDLSSGADGAITALASPLSIIMDSELSDQELFYLRKLHQTYFYDSSMSCI